MEQVVLEQFAKGNPSSNVAVTYLGFSSINLRAPDLRH